MTKHPIGGMWERAEWEVDTDYEVSYYGPQYGNAVPCKHCGPIVTTEHLNTNGLPFKIQHFVCPRVVIGTNEGGYASTGICLDCILEAYQ